MRSAANVERDVEKSGMAEPLEGLCLQGSPNIYRCGKKLDELPPVTPSFPLLAIATI
jgi:hypothetical protein